MKNRNRCQCHRRKTDNGYPMS
ncbi:hypothetical protein F383_04760 [Gossypium arboreum]|uniref:Uncharacterized protein n=1 Tax=Gossypium arboreum TaxID=29729 RepID=A0A0B0NVH8_GOSAR|nr:hypothetical protein F383_04760 [Gossypium arboreum]